MHNAEQAPAIGSLLNQDTIRSFKTHHPKYYMDSTQNPPNEVTALLLEEKEQTCINIQANRTASRS